MCIRDSSYIIRNTVLRQHARNNRIIYIMIYVRYLITVSYTHLDVYKRQSLQSELGPFLGFCSASPRSTGCLPVRTRACRRRWGRYHTTGKEADTLEGRIVKLSDKIAYINHDIDDAIVAGVLSEDLSLIHI